MKFKKQKRFQDVDTLLKAREINIPKTKEYLYDYKLQEALKNRQHYSQEEFKNKFKIEFDDLPISQITKNALRQRKFYKMTEIQRCTIPHALAGRDILGASRTGSGKTLAYLIPLVENLYIQKWSPLDKLGALIILPTRELAMQVAEVLNSIAQQHLLSTGLLIGGKSYEYEKRQVEFMNILICTPGRLLHHLEETPNFDASNLKILVLDEADEMLEMGFWGALKSIMQYLPKEKQTLLFSATLSKSIHQLSKISLINPETIFLHSNNEQLDTPQKLQQFYLVSPIEDKIDILYSFIRNHNRQKILIFVSTCKQVRFLYEAFRKLKIGLPLMELHGRQKQEKRTAIFFTFTEKRAAALFTTNIAARGLDFPKIDWVIQFDCPEDVETYVHRVGRTARYNAGGYSLLFLTPSEQAFTQKLADKKIVAKQKFLNGTKQLTIKQTLQSLVSENVELKYLAQRAFISYVRSIDIMKDKDIFNVNQIKSDLLAESFGLIQVPVIQQVEEDNEEQEQEEPKKSKLQKLKEKIEMKKQMAQEANKPLEIKKIKQLQRESDFQKFENIKYKEDKKIEDHFIGGLLVKKENKQKQIEEELEKPKFITSKRQMKKVKEDGIFGGRNKVFYDDEGNPITADEKRQREIEQEQELALNEDRTQRYAQKLQSLRVGKKKVKEKEEKSFALIAIIIMIKISNSFYAFSKDYQNSKQQFYNQQSPPPKLAEDLDRFLRSSKYSSLYSMSPQRTQKQKIDFKDSQKPSYYFIEYQKRFHIDSNCNHMRFGQQQSPLRTESFDQYREQLSKKDQIYHLNVSELRYNQNEILPQQKREELQNLIQTQKKFKLAKEQLHLHKQQVRIAYNLHRDDKPCPRLINPYQIYKNTNRNIEFANSQSIEPKLETYHELSKDWCKKRKSVQPRNNTQDRTINQLPKVEKMNSERESYLRYQDKRGRGFNLINFTQD